MSQLSNPLIYTPAKENATNSETSETISMLSLHIS